MKQNSSSRRVNAQAQEVIASILLFDISDSRLSSVTITGCEVSFDRSVCNVFYTAPKDDYERVELAFSKAGGRIRSLMSKQLSWRKVPELHFILDSTVDEAARIGDAIAGEEARQVAGEFDASNYKGKTVADSMSDSMAKSATDSVAGSETVSA